ncbi:helix-turn-helix domain-containing protein [Paracoccus sp. TK19116]|uniref:Helix-turn-helix domain-containing protein n=1 Tax=Paracoccus albicereus TaxID=2922394 RepID=A0ABT1MPQ8_9RHOB|nr:helix-turn-helix transcriptional regulator [Paracoccus albicereus]MCQ0970104.1 helix-turn-helix domain-containing protein [Paracoccus albicereus]
MSSASADDGVAFGARLLAAREARQWNQSELARRSGLQPAAIGHFEHGRRKPSFANIRALARALDVSADFLLGTTPGLEGATTAFRNEEHLSGEDRERIQMMIDAFTQQRQQGPR